MLEDAEECSSVGNVSSPLVVQQHPQLKTLQRVSVQIDACTGRKYFVKDGKRFEILSQPPQISQRAVMNTVRNVVTAPPALAPITVTSIDNIMANINNAQTNNKITILPLGPIPTDKQTIALPTIDGLQLTTAATPQTMTISSGKLVKIIDNRIINAPILNTNLNMKQMVTNHYVETAPMVEQQSLLLPKNKTESTSNKTMDTVKYHVVSMSVKNDKGTSTDGLIVEEPKDSIERVEIGIQTDPEEAPIINEDFVRFILDDFGKSPQREPRNEQVAIVRPTSKYEREKFNFFCDMRKSLTFDKTGNLAIHESVLQDNIRDVTRNCILLKAWKTSIDIDNCHHRTPLHLAVDVGNANPAIVKVLLSFGANVYRVDPEGNNAFHLAVEHGRPNILQLLLEHTKRTTKCHLNDLNYEGMTPLILATVASSAEMVRMLLEHGADPNVNDSKSGRTALFHAAVNHDVPIVQLLMEYRADPKKKNFFGTSTHDAMFEMDDIPPTIKSLILVREYQKHVTKRTLAEAAASGARPRRPRNRDAEEAATQPPKKRRRKVAPSSEAKMDVNSVLECITEEEDPLATP